MQPIPFPHQFGSLPTTNHKQRADIGRNNILQTPRQVGQIKQAATEGASSAPMRVGNLESERAIMDVRDVAKAYMALIEQGRSGEIYNICNGAPQPMSTMLDTLCDIANVKLETETDPDLWRPTDRSPELECSKILADTDWHPAYSMEQTLAGVLESV